MKPLIKFLAIICLPLFICCTDNDSQPTTNIPAEQTPKPLRYLALGDSYTIGQSVCESCRFPEQLKQQLATSLDTLISLKIIAQTGWTTSNLKSAIAAENVSSEYDLVTLLIGVNNQYQNKPFELYQQEFPELLTKAIQLAKGNKNNVIVVSIPDYAFTPFGQNTSNPESISLAIDQYNAFAKNYSEIKNRWRLQMSLL